MVKVVRQSSRGDPGTMRRSKVVPVGVALLLSVLLIRFCCEDEASRQLGFFVGLLGLKKENNADSLLEHNIAGNTIAAIESISSVKSTLVPSTSITSVKSGSDTVLFQQLKNGGFCSPSECPQEIRNRIRQSWIEVPNAPDRAEANEENEWADVRYVEGKSFPMLHRSPRRDKFISGSIAAGKIHDPHILNVLQMYLQPPENKADPRPVFVDVGANIGYFSAIALSMGAEVISFEPFLDNAAVFMSTVRKNEWKDRSHHYLNAVSYKTSSRVKMQSTNAGVNLSNMSIRGSSCSKTQENINEVYGIDFMEAVSLDMVMLTNHKDIPRVNLMKIDVETHELHALNGAMNFLCNRIVDAITVEVEYLKPGYNLLKDNCRFEPMRNQLEQMGYTLMDTPKSRDLTGMSLDKLPSDVLFVQQHLDQSPARRLEGSSTNPCRDFTLSD